MKTTEQTSRFGLKPVITSFLTGILSMINMVVLAWTAWTKYDVAQAIFCLPFLVIFAFFGYHLFFNAHDRWLEYKTQKPYNYD